MRLRIAALLPLALVAGCAMSPEIESPAPAAMPIMRWDHRPESAEWTASTMNALRNQGAPLLSEIPADINEYCPGYITATEDERAAFWAGIFSALAKHESTWNPAASGGGGQWIGLVQIAPMTARHYGCEAQTTAALKDGAANLACAVRIAAHTVVRDGYVGTGREGLAADWAPFLNAAKRADMVEWTRQQPYCQAS